MKVKSLFYLLLSPYGRGWINIFGWSHANQQNWEVKCFQHLAGYVVTLRIYDPRRKPTSDYPDSAAHVTALTSSPACKTHLFPGVETGILSPWCLIGVPCASGGVLSERPDHPLCEEPHTWVTLMIRRFSFLCCIMCDHHRRWFPSSLWTLFLTVLLQLTIIPIGSH